MPAAARIAMWSGPRNISTALLRSWGSRPDCFVCDEPFYARYLQRTGLAHPGAAEIIAKHETDFARVVEWLTGPIPDGKAIFYQKQMAHHVLPGDDMSWIERVRNAFLIRDPLEMITSFVKVIPDPRPEQLGLPQEAEMFERVRRRTGRVPPVVDARDVLENPRGVLAKLCAALEVPFDERMLRWEPGPRPTDGVWGPHWYAAVYQSTTFERYRPKNEPLPPGLEGTYRECQRLYRILHEHRITA